MNKGRYIVILTLILTLGNLKVIGQTDSIRFRNGTLLTGEIVSMEKGVLILSTDFSSSNFRAEWKDVVWLKSETKFLIKLRTENRYGSISTLNDSLSQINGNNNQIDTCRTDEIVYLNAYSVKFSDRFNAEISIGFDMTKSQNLRTFSTRSKVSYDADKWYANISFNTLNSSQDDTEDIVRLDGALNFRYIIFNNWYVIATESWLSNTEQMLNLRLNSQLGMGRFIFKTNRAYWGTKFGLNRNIEKYSDENADRNTWEGFLGSELNIYDLGDLNLVFDLIVYPSFTESGRWRSDITFDIKYDLPFDFFIKLGTTLNYDNQPVSETENLDYVLHTGFGWQW